MSASSVEERIVEMTFKSGSFEGNVKTTVSALQSLKDHLHFQSEESSINSLQNTGSKFSLSGMSKAADDVGSHFSAMRVVAFTALANITNRALNAGISLVKSLTITPILDGLNVYETKINSIQTILANTQAQGTTLNQVTSALQQLNIYANATVFSFSDMAKNIGTFTAAGVGLNQSVSSIKGIANLAALSGASADRASGAMYQLSQAIAAGSVKLQDWNSVVNAGLGGKTFQTALVNTARATGVNIDAIIKKAGSFRNSLQQGWLTSKILTQTLSQFTGDLSLKQIEAMGFTDKEAQAILKMGKTAVASAVNIRTVSQLMQALKEDVATSWAAVWEQLIGDIRTATVVLTKVYNVLSNLFTKPINDLAIFLKGFNAVGGMNLVIQSFIDIFHALSTIMHTVGQAWRDVFPPVTVDQVAKLVQDFEEFTASLTPSAKTLDELRRTLDGVFSVIKIGIDIIEDAFKGFSQVGSAAHDAGGGILSITARIGDFLVRMKNFVESGNALVTIFKAVGTILTLPLKAIGLLSTGLNDAADAAKKAFSFLQPFFQKVGDALKGFGKIVEQALSSGDLNNIAQLINQGIFATLLLAIKKWFKGLGDAAPKKGLFDTIKESFEQLTGTLKTMQASLKSDILLKIAAAVGILTLSMIALSFINPAALGKALTAIAGVFTTLLAATAILVKISASGGIVKMVAISGALILLSTAVLILSAAVAILAQFSWTQLAKGLGSIAIILLEFAIFSALTGSGKGLISTAIAMNAIAVAINLLAIAVGNIGKLDIATLAKGIGSIAAILLIFAGFNAISGKQSIATAASLVVIGAALLIIGQAVAQLGSLSLSTIGKGLLGIAGALLIIVVAVNLMPPTMILTAVGLLAVAEALSIIAGVMTTLGGMSWSEIGKSLVELAGALLLIAAATLAMTTALPGAAALLVVAAALAILTPVLVQLGALSWEAIIKGLAALAGVFIILGLAGLLLTPLIPSLLGLGLAITLIGVGVLAAGVGLALFAAALGVLAVSIEVAGVAIVAFISQLFGLIPLFGKELGAAVVSFATVIRVGAPAIVGALVAVLSSLLSAIIVLVPKAVTAFTALITGMATAITKNDKPIITTMTNLIITLLTVLGSKAGQFVASGVTLIVNILNGINANLHRITAAATSLIVNFIGQIGASSLRVTQAGINMIINFVNGLANQIRNATPQMRAAGINLAGAIADGMTFGLASKVGAVVGAAENLVSGIPSAVKKLLGINSPAKVMIPLGEGVGEGVVVGLNNSVDNVKSGSAGLASAALDAMKDGLSQVSDLVDGNLTNLQPTITPVLDLTQAKTGFAALTSLSKDQLLNVGSPLSKATSISSDNAAAATALAATTGAGTSLVFNQTNNSPVALSSAEIYRQTKNQLSVVKGALPTSAKQG